MRETDVLNKEKVKKQRIKFSVYMIGGVILLVIGFMASISFGAAEMRLGTAWGALFQFDKNFTEHHIIRTLRFPRTVADMIVGSCLGVAGAIMQGTTRNPLADSGLMGIGSGSTFAVAICLAFIPDKTYGLTVLFACIGAGIATGMTFFVASLGKRGMTPQRLVLAGMSISMLFSAFSSYLAIKYRIGQSLTYWSAGGTANAKWSELAIVAPFFVFGILIAITLSPSVTVMSLGEEVAIGLGIKTGLIKAISTVVVFILTGLSVAIVGPISFVGLLFPIL